MSAAKSRARCALLSSPYGASSLSMSAARMVASRALFDPFGVEIARPDRGADDGADDALEVHLGGAFVEGALEGLGHLLESGDLRDPDFVVFGEGEAEAFGDVLGEAIVGAELARPFRR